MRILAYEFVSGGGLAGRDVPLSLAREGAAMLAALVEDLSALQDHQILTTTDSRFTLDVPSGVEVVTVSSSGPMIDPLIEAVDAVWLVAPETNGWLEHLAETVERKGKVLLCSDHLAIRQVSDKAALGRRLDGLGVAHPKTHVIDPGEPWDISVHGMEYPVVLKPLRGAGCEGVSLVRSSIELHQAMAVDRRLHGQREFLAQEYIDGAPASVSMVCDGSHAVALALNSQSIDFSTSVSYRGGTTPFTHPLSQEAITAARSACASVSGLRGYVGVDLVLTACDAVVIEINPRLTTAYLGIRASMDENLAALTIAACAGTRPAAPSARRQINFTADGRITSSRSLPATSNAA